LALPVVEKWVPLAAPRRSAASLVLRVLEPAYQVWDEILVQSVAVARKELVVAAAAHPRVA
jgi:hypothetical protein